MQKLDGTRRTDEEGESVEDLLTFQDNTEQHQRVNETKVVVQRYQGCILGKNATCETKIHGGVRKAHDKKTESDMRSNFHF